MTGQQRSFLKGLAQTRKPLSQLGKEGITDAFLSDLDRMLEQHELVKISILESFPGELKEAAETIVSRSDAEFVQLIGRKLVIYRQSRTNPELEIPGADNKRVYANRHRKEQQKLAKRRK
ncbi:MAG: YhbY family RNA-binding protein [Bacillota bacterium]|nr:YhbY family RNA-binding protein [Bacillota bacterium]